MYKLCSLLTSLKLSTIEYKFYSLSTSLKLTVFLPMIPKNPIQYTPKRSMNVGYSEADITYKY